MEIPKNFNGMNFVKAYTNHVLYTNGLWNECYTYWDLGINKSEQKPKYYKGATNCKMMKHLL